MSTTAASAAARTARERVRWSVRRGRSALLPLWWSSAWWRWDRGAAGRWVGRAVGPAGEVGLGLLVRSAGPRVTSAGTRVRLAGPRVRSAALPVRSGGLSGRLGSRARPPGACRAAAGRASAGEVGAWPGSRPRPPRRVPVLGPRRCRRAGGCGGWAGGRDRPDAAAGRVVRGARARRAGLVRVPPGARSAGSGARWALRCGRALRCWRGALRGGRGRGGGGGGERREALTVAERGGPAYPVQERATRDGLAAGRAAQQVDRPRPGRSGPPGPCATVH